MALLHTPICDFGWGAPDFALLGLNNKTYNYNDIAGQNGVLVMFISNHCPYVLAVETRIARDAKELQKLEIGVVAIGSNDVVNYPQDGPDGMRDQVKRAGFSFPYLHDVDQSVARAYGAVCTPDFFGFDKEGGLQYRGRLDASRSSTGAADAKRELFEAMQQVAEIGKGPTLQTPSMGCSIKWK